MSSIKNTYDELMGLSLDVVDSIQWENNGVYTNWLAQTFFYARYTTRIIALASANLNINDIDTHKSFLKHLREENGHEKIAISDLKKMGKDITQFTPNEITNHLYQSQWFWISQCPMSVYGYFLYLEGIAIVHGPRIHERLSKKFPKDSIKYFAVHVEEDVDHVEKHFSLLQEREKFEVDMINENMEQTAKTYLSFLKQINATTNGSQESPVFKESA